MEQRSWFYRNALFYSLLALVLLLHFFLLAMRFRMNRELSDGRDRAIKVRIVDEKRDNRPRQIVRSEDSPEKTFPVDPSYLSDRDRAFEKQTRAKKVAPFHQGGGKDLSLSDLGAFSKGHDPLKVAAKELKQKKNQNRGVSSTNDFVEEVPLGDLTYLNTIEYKYYGFYLRIRQKLEQFWGRSIQETAESLYKEGRKIAGEQNLITSLIVTMNSLGEIIDVHIRETSGVRELDDAAVESFNAAGPFPNPPKGLIVNGRVRIEWGFVVNT